MQLQVYARSSRPYHVIFSLSQWTSCCAGYGNTWPNQCWLSAWTLIVHQVFGMILNAITVGVIFSRVSFPQQRGRTIAISDSAVIARRDGILKFMFRIADIRQTQVRVPTKLCCDLHQPPVADMSTLDMLHMLRWARRVLCNP